MNVANALAAAAAAWAAGAHLHDIRQGLRTFTTSFFQAPGRLNESRSTATRSSSTTATTSTACAAWPSSWTAHGRRRPTAPAARARSRASASSACPAIGATRTCASYGAIAARAFDEIVVREDKNLRGRQPGESAILLVEGIRRCPGRRRRGGPVASRSILDELDAVRAGLRRANPGDLVVICADDTIGGLSRGDGESQPARGWDGAAIPASSRRSRAEPWRSRPQVRSRPWISG